MLTENIKNDYFTSFEEVYLKGFDVVVRYCIKRGFDRSDAENIAQEIFIQVKDELDYTYTKSQMLSFLCKGACALFHDYRNHFLHATRNISWDEIVDSVDDADNTEHSHLASALQFNEVGYDHVDNMASFANLYKSVENTLCASKKQIFKLLLEDNLLTYIYERAMYISYQDKNNPKYINNLNIVTPDKNDVIYNKNGINIKRATYVKLIAELKSYVKKENLCCDSF